MIGSLIIGFSSLILFLIFQAQGIYAGDSGDLVTAAFLGGVPHPPGFPLYTTLGWVLTKLPLFTVSWRVSLLSNLPHAFAVALLFALVQRLTKNTVAAIFSALALTANYLFFLYSVTPEVFALLDFFVLSVTYLLFLYTETKKISYMYAASLVFGLSLTHHYVILFLVPAFTILVFPTWAKIHRARLVGEAIRCVGLTIIGLLPYGMIPILAGRDAIIDWDRAVTWSGFFRLISRADYGTFVSNGSFGQSLQERFLSIVAYGDFFRTDWTWVGIVLVFFGCIWLYRKKRQLFFSLAVGIISIGPIFFFYASFPIVSRFTLGTYERFLLPSYTLVAILLGVGFLECERLIQNMFTRIIRPTRARLTTLFICLTLFIYPLSIGSVTVWRFIGMRTDKTAEHLGMDVLASAPPNAVILLSQDTALFTTQYVRYVLGLRPDTAVIHAARLSFADYQQILRLHFPDLIYPDTTSKEYLSTFIKANRTKDRRVFSNSILSIGAGWYWVSRGLLYEAVPEGELPQVRLLAADMDRIRPHLHDPRDGILSRYHHLMLSDVLEVYTDAHIAVAETYMRAGLYTAARDELTVAVSYGSESSSVKAYELLSQVTALLGECDTAFISLDQAKIQTIVPKSEHLKLAAFIYRQCLDDEENARRMDDLYEREREKAEKSLEAL